MNENNDDEEKKKIEKEIEELLNEIGDFPKKNKKIYTYLRYLLATPLRICKGRITIFFVLLRDLTAKISLNQLMISSIILICFSLFFRRINIFLMQWLFILSSVLFIICFAGLTLFSTKKNQKKYWRGRMINDQDESLLKKIKRFFKFKKD
jgi:hypothetical protein